MRYLFPKNTAQLIHWYERYISPISLIAGFLFDNLVILRRVDLWEGNVLLFFHLIMSAVGITLLNLVEAGRLRGPRMLKIAPFLPIVIQFSFGSLFSAYVSLYSRSASLPIGWIFVVALAVLMIGNERFSRFYTRFSVQMPFYFTVLFSYLIFFLPVMTKSIGPTMFLLGGGISLVVIVVFVLFLVAATRATTRKERSSAIHAIIVIYVLFNAAYFLNLIPPLPLAIKNAGVYHYVIHDTNSSYKLLGEPLPWYEQFLPYSRTFHRAPGESASVFSAVFAPSGLTTTILHQWQRYNDKTKQWETTDTVSFAITGGRDGGYRGYTIKSGIQPGAWRVNVITEYGQLIGRINFTVVGVSTPVLLSQTIQ